MNEDIHKALRQRNDYMIIKFEIDLCPMQLIFSTYFK